MINIEKFADKIDHHDLIVIEEALVVAKKTYLDMYKKIKEELIRSPLLCEVDDNDRSLIADRMMSCCHYFDKTLEIDRILSVYTDVRVDDYSNKDF